MGQALPNQPLIDIVGASANEQRLLIIGSSDTDLGTVYLLDKSTSQLEELLPMRQFLRYQPMDQMQPVTYPAADGTQVHGYLTLPPGMDSAAGLPAIVLPHGGPYGVRDALTYDDGVQLLASRG